MPVIKCKMCGGDLNIVEDSTVCECEYCGTKQTVPKVDDEKKLKLFERANRLRTACEFDKAAGVYESIVADFDEEAEAYWGLILCKFGIEYVDDPATGNKIPTCHRSSFDSLMDDPNFDMVMECADPIARKVYREEAKQIEELRKRIIEVSSQEEPYDVFISYKELDDEGQRTLDSVITQDIYTELTEKGYRVFFSRISLEDKLGVEYEPYIFAALNSAKVMLVVGTDYDYFNAVWVKNEWSRFLMLIASGQKKTLIPVFKGIDAYDMPKEFRKLAAQDMGKVGSMQDLVRGVEKLLGKGGAAETPKEQPVIAQSGGPNVTALLDRGYLSLEDGDWAKAIALFDQVLNVEPRNAEAYLGLAMAEEKCKDKDALYLSYINPTSNCKTNKNLLRAHQFSGNELHNWFKKVEKAATKETIEAFNRLQSIRKLNQSCQYMIATGCWHTVGVRINGTAIATVFEGGPQYYNNQCDISEWTNIIAIAAGGKHTVGLKADGSVISVGDQNVKYDWTDVVSIATGDYHTIGLRSDGTVLAKFTGYIKSDNKGQCDVSGWRNIVSIAAGFEHSVGLKSDGTVVAVGLNYNGQCEVSGWSDIVAVAAGGGHTVGLRSNGTVVATKHGNRWYSGQCDVSGWTDIVAVSAGSNHTVGLKADGTVIATKYIESDDEDYIDHHEGQCDVSAWKEIVSIKAGFKHTVGLKADGTVVSTGSNTFGQCNISGWKLFNNVVTIETERNAMVQKVKAEQKAAKERAEAERKAAKEKAEAEQKATAKKVEAERQRKRNNLKTEQTHLQTELANLRGLFTGRHRKEIEARLAEIEADLRKYS